MINEHAAMADPELQPRGVRCFLIFRILWIFVEISIGIEAFIKNKLVRLAAKLTSPSAGAAGTGTVTATRVADICAVIDGHAAAGTMSGKQVAAICAMIDGRHDDEATEAGCREGRRRRWRVGDARCYRQTRRLSKGAFGLVVKARHQGTAQAVAVKTIRARAGARRPDVGELLREACFLAACRGHPYLVGLHGVVRDPATREFCLVMEYVGPSLRHALDRHVERHGRAFPEADVRRVMRQLLTGTAAMHERGIKPVNVLVVDGNVVKICDYGLAMCTAVAEPSYAQAGTICYMAPELLLEKPDYDARVDLWSLGCVMAELLSGEALFNGDEAKEQLRKICDVLGVPGKKTWKGFKSTLLGDEVQQWRAMQQEAQRHGRLSEMFPEELLSRDGFHVLKGLLTCSPGKRLTAATALRYPWFNDGTVDASVADHVRSFCKIGATALLRQVTLSLAWVLISAWAWFRQVALSLVRFSTGTSGLLKHKALPRRFSCEL